MGRGLYFRRLERTSDPLLTSPAWVAGERVYIFGGWRELRPSPDLSRMDIWGGVSIYGGLKGLAALTRPLPLGFGGGVFILRGWKGLAALSRPLPLWVLARSPCLSGRFRFWSM